MTFALAAAIGVALGLLGGGGSILVVPALTYLMGFDTKTAVVTSLAVVGLAAAAGAAWSFARGKLAVLPALIIGSTMMVGAYGGALIGARLADRTQMVILAAVMLGAAIIMIYRSMADEGATPAVAAHPAALGLLGVGLGVITGLVGVGGGFLIVPALVIVGGLPMRAASSASLLAITMGALAGLAGYSGRVHLEWGFVFAFAAVAAAGTIAGGLLADRLPQRRLQQIFAAALVAIAVFILTRG